MLSKWLYVVAVLIVLDYSGPKVVESCSCMPDHPQSHFCKADFAVVARVKRLIKSEKNMDNIYRVIVRKVFKASDKARVALKRSKIYTPMDDGMCGRELQLNQTYLLTGNVYHLQAHINLCNYAEPWRNVTPRQRKGFRLLYKQGCSCKIQPNFGRRSQRPPARHSCQWTNPMSQDDCFTPYGICLSNRAGRCNWSRSPMLTKCLRRTTTSPPTERYTFT